MDEANAAPPTLASEAFGAVVEAGVAVLLAEPWRIARIIRGAQTMTLHELAAEIARKRRAGPPVDINRAIAFAQLARAAKSPGFAEIWAAWREERE